METGLSTSTAQTQPAPRSVRPAQIDRFTIEQSLGRSSHGTVLLATEQRLSRKVALTLLRPRAIKTGELELESEVRVVSQLQHPNLVTLHEIGTYHHLRYLVFELIDGEPLKGRRRRLPP